MEKGEIKLYATSMKKKNLIEVESVFCAPPILKLPYSFLQSRAFLILDLDKVLHNCLYEIKPV